MADNSLALKLLDWKPKKNIHDFWKNLKEQKDFSIGKKQNSKFLSKIFQIKTLLKNKKQKNSNFQIKLKIFIRKKHQEEALKIPSDLKVEANNIETYATDTTLIEQSSGNTRNAAAT